MEGGNRPHPPTPPVLLRMTFFNLEMKISHPKNLLMRVSCSTGLAAVLALGTPAAAQSYQDTYRELLQQYAGTWRVDYAAWHANRADVEALDSVVAAMEKVTVPALSDAAQQAFYINLYNAAMLQLVLDHYPVDSVTNIRGGFGIFKEPLVTLDGRRLSLDGIEKGILLERWDEPRHHFAVNCASVGCPPLRNEPYTAADLDNQLEEQARLYLNSRYGARLDRRERVVHVSALFDWYADDFPGTNPVTYINRYREPGLPAGYPVRYLEYDWSLNDAD